MSTRGRESVASPSPERQDGREESRYFLRSKILQGFKAAGVLPLTVVDGRVHCLLGSEQRGRRICWSDFGGAREAADSDAAATAAREFAEETLGLFGGCGVDAAAVATSASAMAQQLRRADRCLLVVHPLRRGSYHMYAAATTFIDPVLFRMAAEQHAARRKQLEGSSEKQEFAWLPLQELLRCVAASKPRYVYTARQRISCQHPGALGRRQLALHPSFAKSLRMGMADLRRLAASLTRAPGSAAPTAGGGQLADSRKAGRGGGGRRRAAGRPAAGVGGGSVSSDAGAAAASSSSGAAAAASVAVPLGPDSTLYYSPCFWNAEPAAAQAVQA